jgi:Tfp pilus assembly protein PilF
VIQLDPRYVNPYKGLGAIYEIQEKPDSARIVYQRLLEIDPQNPLATQKLQELGGE